MSRKHLLIVSLLVTVPLLVFLWLGQRLVRSEQEHMQRQFQELLRANLGEVDRTIASYFATQEQRLLLLELGNATLEQLRSIVREEATFEQIVLLDSDGVPMFPNQPLSRREADYLMKIQRVLMDRNLMRLAGGHEPIDRSTAPEPTQQLASPPTVTKTALKSLSNPQAAQNTRSPRSPGYGWYTWYWGKGLQLLHWHGLEDGRVLAVGLPRARWMADIIALLPDSTQDVTAPAQIRLVDAEARTVYQWGTKALPSDAQPIASLHLSAPLRPWQLQHFGPSQPLNAGSSAFLLNLVAAGGFLTAGLLGLAIYLSREIGRHMREARQRVSFVNQVSHELKTPLTNIRMYADLLEQDLQLMEPDENDRARAHLSVITSESSRLGRLINNVLSLARLRRDATQMRRQVGSVDRIIHGVVDQFRPSLNELKIAVLLDLETKPPVMVDVDAVEQMLGNLFSNVEKYAADGPHLRISSRRREEMTIIDVVDTGPGVPPEFAQRVFEPFERASNHLESAAGTGIGLAIAQGLARRHGGDLVLVEKNDGAHFRLSIHTPSADQADNVQSEREPP